MIRKFFGYNILSFRIQPYCIERDLKTAIFAVQRGASNFKEHLNIAPTAIAVD